MATRGLQKGGRGCGLIEIGASFCGSSDLRRKCTPAALFFGKNDACNGKLQGANRNPFRSRASKEEDRGVSSLSVCTDGLFCGQNPNTYQSPPTGEKLDQWMKDSVIEIVRHIQEAPFLHYVFDKDSSASRLKRQRVSEKMFERSDCWVAIRDSLRDLSPDAVILVQKLDGDSMCKFCAVQSPESGDHLSCRDQERQNLDEGCTATWGLLVQGRSPGSSACYILKTTQSVSGNGYCTHFCITRATCFGPPAQIQLANSWLLQSEI